MREREREKAKDRQIDRQIERERENERQRVQLGVEVLSARCVSLKDKIGLRQIYKVFQRLQRQIENGTHQQINEQRRERDRAKDIYRLEFEIIDYKWMSR